jgi:fluoride exporter
MECSEPRQRCARLRFLLWIGTSGHAVRFASLAWGVKPKGEGLQKYLLIALGGALGSIARYWVGSAISSRLGVRFPWGTLVINLTACIIIGFAMTFLGKRAGMSPALFYLVPVGFVGAYSTFSTYEWESLSLMRAGAFPLAALYAVGSLILGLGAVWCGMLAAEWMP